jgi:ABC-2 type transport system ATP-binding protein
VNVHQAAAAGGDGASVRRTAEAAGAVPALAVAAGVTRRFGAFIAVDNVDLEVRPGEVLGLIGANGAGKTTLIRMLLGLLRPSSGTIRLFGQAPSRQTRQRLGYVPQTLGLYDDLTPRENLAFASAAFGGERSGGHGGTAGALLTALGELADVPVRDLPLGVTRRVAFAQALAHHPDLLVLDEPTSGVDPLARIRLWETVREAADAGAGVLVTTHQMEEAQECDRLVVMTAGRVVASGQVAEIVGSAQVTIVDTQDWAAAFAAVEAAGLPAALVGRSLRIPGTPPETVRDALGQLPARLYEAPATLEERFLELTRTRPDSAGQPDAAGAAA